jgi:acetyl esterase/lipase
MNIFLPKNTTKAVPFILLIHGGGWSEGSKDDVNSMCEALNDMGYAAITMNYRLTPDGADYLDMLDDIKSVLQYLKDNSSEFNIKTDEAALIGQSAGAHLSLLYGYKIKESPIDISFIVSMSGPSDLTNKDYISESVNIGYLLKGLTGEEYNYEGEAPASWIDASPITYVTSSSPYTIILHGTKDQIVPYSEAVNLSKKLTDNSVKNDFITYQDSDHDLSGDIEANKEFETIIQKALTDYLPIE